MLQELTMTPELAITKPTKAMAKSTYSPTRLSDEEEYVEEFID